MKLMPLSLVNQASYKNDQNSRTVHNEGIEIPVSNRQLFSLVQ